MWSSHSPRAMIRLTGRRIDGKGITCLFPWCAAPSLTNAAASPLLAMPWKPANISLPSIGNLVLENCCQQQNHN